MNKTAIGWVRNPDGTPGFTRNPITGCLNSCRDTYCYASKLANGRLKARYVANDQIATVYAEGGEPYHQADKAIATIDPFYPRFWSGKLEDVSPLDKPRGIFVCDMGELFGPWLPHTWTEQVMEAISEAPQHRFYLLTKQPQELAKWSPFPPNYWVGVSSTDARSFIEAFHFLGGVEATVKYISMEPLLSWTAHTETDWLVDLLKGIDWLIIGAQTKPTIMPDISWVREIVEAADRAGVKVFLKNSLKPLLSSDALTCAEPFYRYRNLGKRDDENPIVYRQEMPEVVPCAV